MFFDNISFIIGDNFDNILDAKTGFLCGNMFEKEYVPYKKYKYALLNAVGEKDQLMLKIYEYDFALNDLSLYLDLHPEDNKVYRMFKLFTEKQRECINIYEKKYGPLELNDSNYENYMWENGPWPFTGGKVNV